MEVDCVVHLNMISLFEKKCHLYHERGRALSTGEIQHTASPLTRLPHLINPRSELVTPRLLWPPAVGRHHEFHWNPRMSVLAKIALQA